MALTDKEQAENYNHFNKVIKEGIDKCKRYELEVKNLREELKRKDEKVKKIIKDYNSMQSYKKGTTDEDKQKLMKMFDVKDVASGKYKEGFFDALKVAEKFILNQNIDKSSKESK